MKKWFLFCLLALGGLLSGCSGGAPTNQVAQVGDIQVRDAWVRAVPVAGMSNGQASYGTGAAYLVLDNQGAAPDRLLRVESDVAAVVELHMSEMKNDVMTMRPVEAIELPAGGQAELNPGGYHIMLIGLTRELKSGDMVTLTLVFEKAGRLAVQAQAQTP